MTERLNDDFFRRLAQSIPGFKAEYAQKAGEKKAQSNGNLKQHPCAACGKFFGSQAKQFSLEPVQPKPHCPSCQKHLDAGDCIFVTLEATDYLITGCPGVLNVGGVVVDTRQLAGKCTVVSSAEFVTLGMRPPDGPKLFEVLKGLCSEVSGSIIFN